MLKVRRATADDAKQLIVYMQQIANEPDVDIPLGPGEFDMTIEQEREFLARFEKTDNSLFLVAECNGVIVGELSCEGGKRRATRHHATVGISVAKNARGQGVGTALMAELMHWAKEGKVLHRLDLLVYARNAAARRLYRKFGFIDEGIRRHAVLTNGEYLDDVMMALLI